MAPSSRLFLHRLQRELRHGVLPVWILEVLADGPTYGYALLKMLRERKKGEFAVSPSMLYSALARLNGFGLVRNFHGRESRGPIRKYYALTQKGWEILPAIRDLELTLRTVGRAPGEVRESKPAARGRRAGDHGA